MLNESIDRNKYPSTGLETDASLNNFKTNDMASSNINIINYEEEKSVDIAHPNEAAATIKDNTLESDFHKVKNLSHYQRLVYGGTPEDVIYKLIVEGNREGTIEIDLDDNSVNPIARFLFLWFEQCLSAIENDHFTSSTVNRTFADLCQQEIRFNVIDGVLEWQFNGEKVIWESFIETMKTIVIPVIEDRKNVLYKASIPNKEGAKAILKVIIENNKYNPIQEWAKKLKWDGINRYETLFKCLGLTVEEGTSHFCTLHFKLCLENLALPLAGYI